MEVDKKANGKRAAEESKVVPKKKAKEEAEEEDDGDKDKRTLFVRNLPFSVTDDQVPHQQFKTPFYLVLKDATEKLDSKKFQINSTRYNKPVPGR